MLLTTESFLQFQIWPLFPMEVLSVQITLQGSHIIWCWKQLPEQVIGISFILYGKEKLGETNMLKIS